MFLVIAYRWGERNNHNYIVGCFSGEETAKQVADTHVAERGGKYGCAVYVIIPDIVYEDSPPYKLVYHASSYYGEKEPIDDNKAEFFRRVGYDVCSTVNEVVPPWIQAIIDWYKKKLGING